MVDAAGGARKQNGTPKPRNQTFEMMMEDAVGEAQPQIAVERRARARGPASRGNQGIPNDRQEDGQGVVTNGAVLSEPVAIPGGQGSG